MKTTKGLVRKQATSDRASRLLNILQVSLSAHFTARSVRERTARSAHRLVGGIGGGILGAVQTVGGSFSHCS